MRRSNAAEHLRTLDAVMHAQRMELNTTRRAAKNMRRRQDRLRKHIFDVCFVLYVWCLPSASLALAFAAHSRRVTEYDAKVSIEELEERFLHTDMVTLTAISSKEGGLSKGVLAEARRFESEHHLFHWVQNQNDRKGVAPNTTMVRDHLARQHVEPVATAGQDTASATAIKSVKWVQRFRTRWALKRGSFMPAERLPREVVGQKVTLSKFKRPPLGCRAPPMTLFTPEPKRGPPGGPQTGAVLSILSLGGAISWPLFWAC